MRRIVCLFAAFLTGLLAVLALVGGAGLLDTSVVKLREISVFSDFPVGRDFRRGQRARLTHESGTNVKAYPTFRSEKPLYGAVSFGGEYSKPGSGYEFHFAIDESSGTGEGYDRLFLDLDRDLDLTNDQPVRAWDSPPVRAKETREKNT